MEFEEVLDKNSIKIPFEYQSDDKIYILKKNNAIVGYGKINTNKNSDILYFMIKEEYQSNGYGSILYQKLLETLKDLKYKEIVIHISNENYKAINIINKFKNIHLTTVKGISKYLIPII